MKRQIISFTVNGEAREIAVTPNRILPTRCVPRPG
jgi:hypothetical protein